MHISVFMGPVAYSAGNDLKQIELCVDQAIRCADAGYAMVTFGEQHFNGYEPYSNPFLMGARLAPHLGDTWFGTTIVPLPFHNPLRLAEEASIVDLLTRGRFVLGMSSGRTGPVPDWDLFGLDQAERSDIFASKLEILQRAVRQRPGDEPLVMDTKWDHGKLIGRMMPTPWRAGGPQFAIGTGDDTLIDEVAGKGWPLFLSPLRISVASTKLGRHRAGLEASGLNTAAQAHARRLSMMTMHCIVGATEEEAWRNAEQLVGRVPMIDRSNDSRSLQEMFAADEHGILDGTDPSPRNANWAQSWLLVGTPDSVIARIREYEAAGFEHLNVRFTAGMARPDLVARSFSLFTDGVLPNIDSAVFPELTADEADPAHSETVAPIGPGPGVISPGGGDYGQRSVPSNEPVPA